MSKSKSKHKITITRKGAEVPYLLVSGYTQWAEVHCTKCGSTTRWLPTRSDAFLLQVAEHHRERVCKG